ncbi:universal stress protein [Halorussus halobius]|uniref:universal stress protein n=1 Tax=Halorussus halobius TaxID=1710537 RepID=UPI001092217C|nr:universal stress protein [Halorussus halobius]
MYDDVLVPTDGSAGAERAFERALDLAETYDARLLVLHVVDVSSEAGEFRPVTVLEDLRERGAELTADLADRAADAGLDDVRTEVLDGVAHRAILSYVEDHGVDVVVMGTHGRTGLQRYLLGSVAEKVVRLSDVPVLTVRASEGENDE